MYDRLAGWLHRECIDRCGPSGWPMGDALWIMGRGQSLGAPGLEGRVSLPATLLLLHAAKLRPRARCAGGCSSSRILYGRVPDPEHEHSELLLIPTPCSSLPSYLSHTIITQLSVCVYTLPTAFPTSSTPESFGPRIDHDETQGTASRRGKSKSRSAARRLRSSRHSVFCLCPVTRSSRLPLHRQ